MQDMFARFFGEGVWAVLEAVLILILAFVAAAIVKSLTVKLLTRTKLQALLGKRDPANCEKVADFIGKLLHLILPHPWPSQYDVGLSAQYPGGGHCPMGRVLYRKTGAGPADPGI